MVPRDILGVPTLSVGVAMNRLPAKVADVVAAPLIRATVGDIRRLGLRRLPYGPNQQMRSKGRVPLLDIGTIGLIRDKKISVIGGIERFERDTVVFAEGEQLPFDAVVLATGYRPALADLLPCWAEVCDADGVPRDSGVETLPGLFFCGFYVSPIGMLREIGIEARRIARAITARRK